jgi:hypothetical protein
MNQQIDLTRVKWAKFRRSTTLPALDDFPGNIIREPESPVSKKTASILLFKTLERTTND